MLTQTQIKEIKEHLEKAQNPVFFYDNDCDGLCSFLILRKYLGRGKGVAIRSFPDLNAQYAKKAQELNADYIFVLDKPLIAKEFFEEVNQLSLPLVWIDHHNIETFMPPQSQNFFLYNPAKHTGKEYSDEPVTYWAYKIIGRKEDLWLAIAGCIADHYLPDFVDEFKSRYPEFWGNVKEPFDAYYKTEIGKIAQSFNFGLKDSTTNIIHLQNFLISTSNPQEVFSEISFNYSFRKKCSEIRKKYDVLLEKAKKSLSDGIIFFEYAGDLSISSDISNELSYLFPEKYIAVAYKRSGISNLSLRGKHIKQILEKTLKNFEYVSGGGHEDAVGARIKTEDLIRFKQTLIKEIEKEKSSNERNKN